MVSKVLKEDLAKFRKAKAKGEGAEELTYAYLRKSIEAYVVNDKLDKIANVL